MTLEAPPPLPQLIDGPADAPATLLFAHGAGAAIAGRVASLLIDQLAASPGVQGCLCFGYPFHPPGSR